MSKSQKKKIKKDIETRAVEANTKNEKKEEIENQNRAEAPKEFEGKNIKSPNKNEKNKEGKNPKNPNEILENLLVIFIVISPVLDMLSFLVRNYFNINFSPSTFLRPIIPIAVFALIWLELPYKSKLKDSMLQNKNESKDNEGLSKNETKSDTTLNKKLNAKLNKNVSSDDTKNDANFWKKFNKRNLAIIAIIYLVYALGHIAVFGSQHTGISYDGVAHEMQYLINYTFGVVILFCFIYTFRNPTKQQKENHMEGQAGSNIAKIEKSIIMMVAIYLVVIIFSIITNTSSYTYPEDKIGIKGWFESGNSVSAILILSLFVILNYREEFYKKIVICEIILLGIFLCLMIGTRVALLGFILVLLLWVIVRILSDLIQKKKLNKGLILKVVAGLTVLFAIMGTVGSNTLERRKDIKQKETEITAQTLDTNSQSQVAELQNGGIIQNTNDENSAIYNNENNSVTTNEDGVGQENDNNSVIINQNNANQNKNDNSDQTQAHLSGDLIKIKTDIDAGLIAPEYMNEAQKKSIQELYEIANKMEISSADQRMQQLIYNAVLVKNQKDLKLILFGNGYNNQFRELVMEMDIPSLLFNFGIFGLLLYFGPFAGILIYAIIVGIKYWRRITEKYVMYLLGLAMAFAISVFSGYVFFNMSTMTIVSAICALLLNETAKMKYTTKDTKI